MNSLAGDKGDLFTICITQSIIWSLFNPVVTMLNPEGSGGIADFRAAAEVAVLFLSLSVQGLHQQGARFFWGFFCEVLVGAALAEAEEECEESWGGRRSRDE